MLNAVQRIIEELLEVLPRSPREDEMLEGKVAWDLATALRVDLECVLGEQLRWVIETLEKAARWTHGDPSDSSGPSWD